MDASGNFIRMGTGDIMTYQEQFDALMARYNSGIEPLENWETADLVRLVNAADAELQNRAPSDDQEG